MTPPRVPPKLPRIRVPARLHPPVPGPDDWPGSTWRHTGTVLRCQPSPGHRCVPLGRLRKLWPEIGGSLAYMGSIETDRTVVVRSDGTHVLGTRLPAGSRATIDLPATIECRYGHRSRIELDPNGRGIWKVRPATN